MKLSQLPPCICTPGYVNMRRGNYKLPVGGCCAAAYSRNQWNTWRHTSILFCSEWRLTVTVIHPAVSIFMLCSTLGNIGVILMWTWMDDDDGPGMETGKEIVSNSTSGELLWFSQIYHIRCVCRVEDFHFYSIFRTHREIPEECE